MVPAVGIVEVTHTGGEAFTTPFALPFCHRGNYTNAIPAGTFFAPGDVEVFFISGLAADDTDLWLYRDSNFGSASSIIHGLVIGDGPFSGQVPVAVAAGIWASLDAFVQAPATGQTLAWDGSGIMPADWYRDATPTLGQPNFTPKGIIASTVRWPGGMQDFESPGIGDDLTVIDGWTVASGDPPGEFTARIVDDVLGTVGPRMGSDSFQFLRILNDSGPGTDVIFGLPIMARHRPLSYEWSFQLLVERAAACGDRLVIEHQEGNGVWKEAWGFNLSPSDVQFFVGEANPIASNAASFPINRVSGGPVTAALNAGDLLINGVDTGATTDDGLSSASGPGSAIAIAAAINGVSLSTNVTARIVRTRRIGTDGAVQAINIDGVVNAIEINGAEINSVNIKEFDSDGALRAAINALEDFPAGTSSVTGTLVTAAFASPDDLVLDGIEVGVSVSDGVSTGQAAGSAIALANAINSVAAQTGVTATANPATRTGTNNAVRALDVAGAPQLPTLTINAVAITLPSMIQADDSDSALRDAINAENATTGVVAGINGSGQLELFAADGRNIEITTTGGDDSDLGMGEALGLVADGGGTEENNVTGDLSRGTLTLTSAERFIIGGGNPAFAGLVPTTLFPTGVVASIDLSNRLVLIAADGRNIAVTTRGGDGSDLGVGEALGLVADGGGTEEDNVTSDLTRGSIILESPDFFTIGGNNPRFAGLVALNPGQTVSRFTWPLVDLAGPAAPDQWISIQLSIDLETGTATVQADGGTPLAVTFEFKPGIAPGRFRFAYISDAGCSPATQILLDDLMIQSMAISGARTWTLYD